MRGKEGLITRKKFIITDGNFVSVRREGKDRFANWFSTRQPVTLKSCMQYEQQKKETVTSHFEHFISSFGTQAANVTPSLGTLFFCIKGSFIFAWFIRSANSVQQLKTPGRKREFFAEQKRVNGGPRPKRGGKGDFRGAKVLRYIRASGTKVHCAL